MSEHFLNNAVAKTAADLRSAHEIRHAAYFADGYLQRRDTELFSDSYDHFPNSTTFLLWAGKAPIGTVRTCVHLGCDGWTEFPARQIFENELTKEFGHKDRFVEITRLAIHPPHRHQYPRAPLALFGNAVHSADAHRCSHMIAAVREEHIRFYSHLCFKLAAPAKVYPGLNFRTALVIMDWGVSRAFL